MTNLQLNNEAWHEWKDAIQRTMQADTEIMMYIYNRYQQSGDESDLNLYKKLQYKIKIMQKNIAWIDEHMYKNFN